MFLPNWSSKIEYLYYDLGKITYAINSTITRIPANAAPIAIVNSQASTHFNANIIRLGISYHGFSWI